MRRTQRALTHALAELAREKRYSAITVQDLSQRMATRGVEVIKFMMRQGMMLKINDVLDAGQAEDITKYVNDKSVPLLASIDSIEACLRMCSILMVAS